MISLSHSQFESNCVNLVPIVNMVLVGIKFDGFSNILGTKLTNSIYFMNLYSLRTKLERVIVSRLN
jgi:hypothetical protein